MRSDFDFYQLERYEDLRREAEHERQIKELLPANRNESGLWDAWMLWLGDKLVESGERLRMRSKKCAADDIQVALG